MIGKEAYISLDSYLASANNFNFKQTNLYIEWVKEILEHNQVDLIKYLKVYMYEMYSFEE